MIRIAVAHHRAIVRAGLEALLGARPDLRIVATVDDASELLDAYPRLRADVCLLDARLPGGGFSLIEQLPVRRGCDTEPATWTLPHWSHEVAMTKGLPPVGAGIIGRATVARCTSPATAASPSTIPRPSSRASWRPGR